MTYGRMLFDIGCCDVWWRDRVRLID